MGEQLSIMCQAPDKTTLKTFCYGFLNGVFGYSVDVVKMRSTAAGKVVVSFKEAPLDQQRICPPTLNGAEMSELFLVYIRSHPDRLTMPAHIAAAETLAAVSSCPK